MNIIICGVGGQGIVLSSSVLSKVLCDRYEDVKASDIISVGQRGGSVVTHIRAGSKVYSPLIREGTGDMVLAFEKYEALRWQHMLSCDGIVIANNKAIIPNTVLAGLEEDIDVDSELKKILHKVHLIDSDDILTERKLSGQLTNMLMMGYLSKFMDIKENYWIKAIEEAVKVQFMHTNIEVFHIGRSLNDREGCLMTKFKTSERIGKDICSEEMAL